MTTMSAASVLAPPSERLSWLRRSRRQRTDAADARVSDLFESSLEQIGLESSSGLAVVALGGYGRGELSVASDLDLLLLYDPSREADACALAERLWYPLWDAGVKVDHSVRTIAETLEAAANLRTALSLLDARHVAGDASLTIALRTTLLTAWRRTARRRIPELEASCRERAERFGELASLLEPDLKQARGGLRDAIVLRALAATWLVEIPHHTLARVHGDLLNIRDVLHQVAGRRVTDRLLADLAPDVATACGLPGRDALLRYVYERGRIMSQIADTAWRRVHHALAARSVRRVNRPATRPGPVMTPLAPGVAAVDGEVVLASEALRLSADRHRADPLLPLRAAYSAADRGLLLAPHTAQRLARDCRPLRVPWPPEARRLFCALLGTGSNLLPVWELLDQTGVIDRLVPAWGRVRCAPQYSPVHRHTVDRHLLETCVQASGLVRRVRRPDLLLVAALLHDIGKPAPEGDAGPAASGSSGRPGSHGGSEHGERGAQIAQRLATRWGFPPEDVATLATLVRHHLLLIDTATRRDLDDPATIEQVVDVVRDLPTLELLAALTEADAKATGPAAWTPWRRNLLGRLVERVRGRLAGGDVPRPAQLEPWQRELAERGEIAVVVEPASVEDDDMARLTVVFPDRVGLLASVAGVLALARLSVHAATVETIGAMGVSVWTVTGDPPDAAVLRERLAVALASRSGEAEVDTHLRRLDEVARQAQAAERRSSRRRARAAEVAVLSPPPDVRLVPASDTATVLEVRAHDRPALFYAICRAVADVGCSVRSAHVSTWAKEAVDVFYVTDSRGAPLDRWLAEKLREAVELSVR